MSVNDTIESNFEYEGKSIKVLGMLIINILLMVVTLGIYSFWGKVKVRRYLIGNLKLAGDYFEYTGTGKELFLGFLKAIPILIIAYLPIILMPQNPLVPLLTFSLLGYLYIVGTYSGLRYRMSRTIWKSIRGRLQGSAFKYAWQYLVRFILNLITLGLMIPSSDKKLFAYKVNNSSFGTVKARFLDGKNNLNRTNIITLLLFIPTLGFSRIWYTTAFNRYSLDNTVIGDSLRLKSTLTGGRLFGHMVVNLLIIAFTFGLGIGIAINRNMNFSVKQHLLLGI